MELHEKRSKDAQGQHDLLHEEKKSHNGGRTIKRHVVDRRRSKKKKKKKKKKRKKKKKIKKKKKKKKIPELDAIRRRGASDKKARLPGEDLILEV